MKKLPVILLTSLFLILYSFFLSPAPAPAGCFPGNPNTGSCDVGFDCTGTGTWCCDTFAECSTTPIPANQTFVCSWNGSSCVVGAQNCDPTTGYLPDPSYCSGFSGASSCNGKVGNCRAPSSGTGSFQFCNANGNQGVPTALGCLDITGKNTVSQILSWAVVVGGGIAFLLIVYAGLQMATASGDPKRVKASQELLTAALGGLVLIVLSIVLLNFIGVKILNLGNLGFSVP